MNKKCSPHCKVYQCPYHFGATVLRLSFGFLFVLIAIKKFRMGYFGFAEMLVNGKGSMAKEIPSFILYAYGTLIPAIEILAGLLLLINKKPKIAYSAIALLYLSFIFGQTYDGNVAIIGSEYIPSLLAVIAGYWLTDHISNHTKKTKA